MKNVLAISNQSLLRKLVFTAVFIILCLTLHSRAYANNTTYYINNLSGSNCSNSGAGTTTTAPWCDFTNATTKTFLPGDQILLARGATWNQELQLVGTGTSTSGIKVDAYGTGNRPKIIRSGNAADVGVRLTNPDYWTLNNLEVGYAGQGILIRMTTLSHSGLALNNIYVHHVTGIYHSTGYAAPDYKTTTDPAGTAQAAADGAPMSSGIMIVGTSATIDDTQYMLRNISLKNIEGTHNMISVDFEIGQINFIGTGNKNNLFQNITLSYMYLHDDDGPSIACPDSMGLIGSTNVLIYDSIIDNAAACHAPNGTAAIYLGRTKNVNFINNILINTPNTGSNDQTAVDFETRNESTNFRSNYIGGNAGPGIEFLAIHGNTDNSSNNEISGNLFAGNQVSIHRYGTDINPAGTIKDNLTADPVFTSGDNFNGFTQSNNLNVSSNFNAAYNFSGVQGANNWSYQYTNDGTTWANFAYYDSAIKTWQPSSSLNVPQISQFGQHPYNGTAYVGRAWTATSSGTISIRGTALKTNITGGDGVNIRITKNNSTIWPTAGSWQSIAYNNQTGVTTNLDNVAVSTGDVIRFEVSNGPGSDSTYDNISWSPSIGYVVCAIEKGQCSFSGQKNVRYGSGTTFVQGTFTDGVNCSSATFGDPTPGVAKYCEITTDTQPTTGIWRFCANENTTCTFTGTKKVAFGANTSFNYGTYTNSVACNNTTLGDPIANVPKKCYTEFLIPIPNGGFETPSTTNFIYGPMTYGWTFNGVAGVTKNGGAFSAATAPEGFQVAFLQGTGAIEQSITSNAGTYSINFHSAKRPTGGQQSFNVYVDSTLIGTYTPTSTSFKTFTTNTFALTAGSHTIKFVGMNSGDNVAFLDAINLQQN